jgi:hypothetical protein
MASIARRASSKFIKILSSAVDAAAESARVISYAKNVVGVPQLFTRAFDGRVSQLTPAVRLATPGESLSAVIAAYPGECIELLPGNHVLDASVASNAETLRFRTGAVLQVPANRTLGSNLDFSQGGRIQPAAAVALSLTGKINLPLSFYAFDVTLGGVFQIKTQCIGTLTPENFGATNLDVVYDDVAVRACIAACEWDALPASGGIQMVFLPGRGYRVGSILTQRVISWGGVPHHSEWVCLKISKGNRRLFGDQDGMTSLHFVPTNQNGPVDDIYILFEWEISDDVTPIKNCSIDGLTLRAGNSADVTKVAMYCHDVRNFVGKNITVENWSDSRRRSYWLRFSGRDNCSFHDCKPSCPIAVILDFNFRESVSLLANGLPDWSLDGSGNPIGVRDNKDSDEINFYNLASALDDQQGQMNIYKAVYLARPGVVFRNWYINGYNALVGGGVACVDRLDGDDDIVEAVNISPADSFTLTGHTIETGDMVQIATTGALPGATPALQLLHFYWAIKLDANTIQLAENITDALDGNPIQINDVGAGVHTISGAAWRGAVVEPRRYRNHMRIRGGRVEGITNAWEEVFAVHFELNQNAPLLEITLDDFLLAEGSSARRAVETGASSFNGAAWSGLWIEGVLRLGWGAGARYNGTGIPIRADINARLGIDPAASLVADDDNFFIPESFAQWDQIELLAPRSWYLFKADPGDPIDDVAEVYDLDPSGAVLPTYQEFRPGFQGFWCKLTNIANQKFRLNSAAAELDPDTNRIAGEGLFWPDVAWAPAGGEVFMNLSGLLAGPLMRVRADFKVELRVAGNNFASQMTYWDDDQPFWCRLFTDPFDQVLCAWLVKQDGRRELIRGTWAAGVGNDVNKGFGPSSAATNSPEVWIRYGAWSLTYAALQDGFEVAGKLNLLKKTGSMGAMDLSGLVISWVSASTIAIATGAARATDNFADIVVLDTLSVDLTVSGAGGLDTGAEAANTTYFIWILGDSLGVNQPVAVASLSSFQPTLPAGYDLQRRIGAIRNNAGSNIIKFYQRGDGRTRTVWYDDDLANLNVLTGGSAIAFTNVSLTGFVPSTSGNVHLLAGFLAPAAPAGAATDQLQLRPDGAVGADGPWNFQPGNTLAAAQRFQLEMPCATTQIIEYRVTDADDDADLWVLGYDDEL